MSVIEISQLVGVGLIVCFVVIIMQVIGISRLLPRSGWWVLAGGFFGLGALQTYRYNRSAAALMEAQRRGVQIPDALTIEQWMIIGWIYIVVFTFIIGLYLIRRGLRAQGLD